MSRLLTTGVISQLVAVPTVTFTVTDNDTSNPIENAEIVIDSQTLTTNSSGVATIDLLNGTYSYDVTATDYDPGSGSVTVNDSDVFENVSLVPVPQQLAVFDDLSHYWKMDETSGGYFYDSIGTSNLGNNTYPVGSQGIINNGGDFTREWDVVSTSLPTLQSSSFSFSFWMKVNSYQSAAGWILQLYSGGTNRLMLYTDDFNNSVRGTVNGRVYNMTPNTGFGWNHFVITSNSSTTRIYWQGSEIINGGTISTGNITSLILGDRATGSGTRYSGWIDEVGIWSRVLTPSEISTLYSEQLNNQEQPA